MQRVVTSSLKHELGELYYIKGKRERYIYGKRISYRTEQMREIKRRERVSWKF